MSAPSPSAARRARLLVRCYPASWRARYGDEFTQLLIDDICERPRSLRRTADVLRAGLLARVTSAGLAGQSRERAAQMRSSLAALGVVVAAFFAMGIAMWSQLAIGWQWSSPASRTTSAAMMLMSGAALCLVGLALLAAVPLVWVAGRAAVQGHWRGLAGPALLAVFATVVFAAGSHHFAHGWPGTGGHPWAGRGLVPSQIASFAWAATLWVTSYWAHPGALSSFPVTEIVWMTASPLALLAGLAGVGETVHRLPLSGRVLRYEIWLGAGAALAMAAFLAGACSWVISGGPAPRQLFHVGAIDGVGLVVMAGALAVACQALQRVLKPRAAAPTPS